MTAVSRGNANGTGWLARWVMLLASVLFLATAQAAPETLDRVIAIVDDDVVLQSELDARVRTVAGRLSSQGAPLPPERILRQRVLDQLLLDSIQLQMADRAGMRVSDNELNETLNNIAQRNGYTLAEFEQALASEGLTYREAREQIRREMLISRMQQRRIDSRVRITDREVETFLASSTGKARSGAEYLIGHILIAVDDFTNDDKVSSARASAEDILRALKEGADFRQLAVARSDGHNALEGGVLGWRRADQLPSLVADVVPSLSVGQTSDILRSGSGFHLVMLLDRRGGTEQIVRQFKVRHILVKPNEIRSDEQARLRADELASQLRSGADFADLAREHSDDPVSGSAGGDLGWVSPGEMVSEFEDVMRKAAVGALEGPFRSRFGWHILQVSDTREQDIGNKLQASQARQTLYQRKYDVELLNWLREIRGEAFIQIKDPTLVSEAAP
ncbi:MAG: peptidylprolyl isomerase [Gammaproteobacteria bacterium]|nr:peptidylprolyl isomerase [Gammaproteobacteria bacterium]